MRYLLTCLLAVICIVHVTYAQQIELQSTLKKKEKPIELTDLSISVSVNGNIATTTMDMLFYNSNKRVMEGNLSFPLNERQEIVRYALDVNGKLREGVVIEKVKARQVFEAVVRKNIDPGIAERTKGNFFKTRIYPVPSKGYKRVVIALDEELEFSENRDLHYNLPIAVKNQLKRFQLDVKVAKSLGKPSLDTNPNNIQFDRKGDFYVLSFEREEYLPKESIAFTLPYFRVNEQLSSTEESANGQYFMINFRKELPIPKTRKSPKKISVYWDNSFSGLKRNIKAEIALLTNYLTSLAGRKKVNVFLFNHELGKAQEFEVKDDASSLALFLKNVIYDGATFTEKLQLNEQSDEVFIFSDGIQTIGKQSLNLSNVRVNTIASSIGADVSFLRFLAEESGGKYINLQSVSQSSAIAQLKTVSVSKFETSCTACSDVYINSYSNDFHTVYGKYNGTNAQLTISLPGWKKNFQVSPKQSNNLNVSRSWARAKIRSLDKQYDTNKDEIQRLGTHFNIVTRNTSFIVLDRVEDYVTYEITPPAELLKEYNQLLQKQKLAEEVNQELVDEKNIDRLERLKSWYLKKYSTKTQKKKKAIQRGAPAAQREFDSFANTEEFEDSDGFGTSDDGFSAEMETLEEVVSSNIAPRSESKSIESDKTAINSQSIKVLPWLPEADYLDALRVSTKDQYETIYLKYREENMTRPAFYLQVSSFLYDAGEIKLSNRILSSLLEVELASPELLKIVGNTFLQRNAHHLAMHVFEEIKSLRPDEPQSLRDLAQAYEANNLFQEALELYYQILMNDWGRFENIKDIVLVEMNALINRQQSQLNLDEINPSYIFPFELGVRVVLSWSSNDNDIDLWVVDPLGDKCYYGNQLTFSGGTFSNDFTQGYGPESFKQKKALEGIYQVSVNYFSESRQTVTGPVTVFATFYTNYGQENEQRDYQVIQLVENKETMKIGELKFDLE